MSFVNRTNADNFFFVYKGAELCTDAETKGAVPPGGERAVSIPAGASVSLAYNFQDVRVLYLTVVTTCRVAMTFTPKQGKKYRVGMVTGPEQCKVSIEEGVTTPAGESYVPVEIRQRTPKNPIVASQGFCEP
jgi:hypothetical protein